MQAQYPDDRFELVLRNIAAAQAPEWRIKCLDCPGKVHPICNYPILIEH